MNLLTLLFGINIGIVDSGINVLDFITAVALEVFAHSFLFKLRYHHSLYKLS